LGRLATEIQSGAISSDQAVTDAEKLGFPGEPVKSFDQLQEAQQYLVVRFDTPAAKLIALDEALTRFAELDPQKAELVKPRYFAGLTEQDAADAPGISRATARVEHRIDVCWNCGYGSNGDSNAKFTESGAGNSTLKSATKNENVSSVVERLSKER
jgi:hypothetical protein